MIKLSFMQLSISNVSKTYANGLKALTNVNLTIAPGMFGLLGPNGAGKSSLMRTISTLQEADGGSIFLDDLDLAISSFDKNTTVDDLEALLKLDSPFQHELDCATMAQAYYLAGNRDGFKDYNKSCETKTFLNHLEERTVSWIPKLEPLLAQGGAFITVGADHMNGINGLEAWMMQDGKFIKITLPCRLALGGLPPSVAL